MRNKKIQAPAWTMWLTKKKENVMKYFLLYSKSFEMYKRKWTKKSQIDNLHKNNYILNYTDYYKLMILTFFHNKLPSYHYISKWNSSFVPDLTNLIHRRKLPLSKKSLYLIIILHPKERINDVFQMAICL